jgi:hypothetical protein
MSGYLRRVFELGTRERRLLATAAVSLAVARLLLRTLPFPQARQRLLGFARALPQSSQTVMETRRAVEAAARWVPGARCLPQAMVLQALLLRAGITSELRIGVRTGRRGQLIAHAWVTRDGLPLLPTEDLSPFGTLASFNWH